MAIVTAAGNGERAGCLVGFHCQCSIEPFRYAVWLSKANRTYRVVLRAATLAVHFLTPANRPLAELFGGTSGDDLDKFDRCRWDEGPHGVPLLVDCPNRVVGRRGVVLDEGGDHVCVVLHDVELASTGGLTPLRLTGVDDITPGHEAEEPPTPTSG